MKKWERKNCLKCNELFAGYDLRLNRLCKFCTCKKRQENPILLNDKNWIYVKDSIDLYVSENANVKRIYKYHNKYYEKLMAQTISTGYYCLKVIGKTRSVHRIFATAFIPNPLNLPQVNHIDGNKLNNKINNLEWVSGSQNIQHAYDIGLSKKFIGEKSSQAKMSNNTVRLIRKFFIKNPKYSRIKISKRFGVCRQTIDNLINNKTY